MSTHKSTLVPISCWGYASPDITMGGKSTDLGLFAEALIYYDQVYVSFTSQADFASFLSWFIKNDSLNDFYALLAEGAIVIHEYSFLSTAILKDGVYSLWNTQDQRQEKKDSFEERFLYDKSVDSLFQKQNHRVKLYKALRNKVIEEKSENFEAAINNARADFFDAERQAAIVQAYVDELYKIRSIKNPKKIVATIKKDHEKSIINYNISFPEITALSNGLIPFDNHLPLTASAHSNRLILSASNLESDLYLPQPMSMLVGDKLYETKEKISKTGSTIESLKIAVEFPNIRELTNSNKLTPKDLIKIRNKSAKFRKWLQQESERDRDAIIAYHNEVSKELGIISTGRAALSIFGVLANGAAGGAIGSSIAGPMGGAIGGAVGSSIGYLIDIGSKLGTNWRPVVFGNWLDSRIKEILDKNQNNQNH